MTSASQCVVLTDIPAPIFDAAIGYLGDMLRECKLVLADHGQGSQVDPELVLLARGFVPDLEELREMFDSGSVTTVGNRHNVQVPMHIGHAATMTHLQMQLLQLRLLGRRGAILTQSDPEISQLLAWVWDESADQLHGRRARPYRLRQV